MVTVGRPLIIGAAAASLIAAFALRILRLRRGTVAAMAERPHFLVASGSTALGDVVQYSPRIASVALIDVPTSPFRRRSPRRSSGEPVSVFAIVDDLRAAPADFVRRHLRSVESSHNRRAFLEAYAQQCRFLHDHSAGGLAFVDVPPDERGGSAAGFSFVSELVGGDFAARLGVDVDAAVAVTVVATGGDAEERVERMRRAACELAVDATALEAQRGRGAGIEIRIPGSNWAGSITARLPASAVLPRSDAALSAACSNGVDALAEASAVPPALASVQSGCAAAQALSGVQRVFRSDGLRVQFLMRPRGRVVQHRLAHCLGTRPEAYRGFVKPDAVAVTYYPEGGEEADEASVSLELLDLSTESVVSEDALCGTAAQLLCAADEIATPTASSLAGRPAAVFDETDGDAHRTCRTYVCPLPAGPGALRRDVLVLRCERDVSESSAGAVGAFLESFVVLDEAP